jgi:hypothetical protein
MGTPYIGDVVFERLNRDEGFAEKARELISADWREGTDTFRRYAGSLVDEIFAKGISRTWGDFEFSYVEGRAMEWVTPKAEPWLWAYKVMTGALVDSGTVRRALRDIEG